MSGAEISGVVDAVEQFVEAASKIVKLVKAVVDQAQDAPDRISQEAGQIESLTSFATKIKTTKSLQTEDVEDILARCGSYMRDLQEILEKISVEHQDSLKKKTWKAICSLQEEEDIVTLFALLHQEYISLDAHINLRTNAVAEAALARLTDLDKQGQPTDLGKICLQDLFITDPIIDRARLITSKGEIVNGTCDWIAQKEEFINWTTSDGGLLWISGGPGLGKTMLSIYLTEYLASFLPPLEDGQYHYSTFFFCDAKDNTRNNSVAIVRGLLFQLLQQKVDLLRHILPIYEIQGQQLFQQNSFEALWNIFLRMTNDIQDSRVSCILDGLDECEPESLQGLLNELNKIASTSPNLKIIVLSREYPSCLGASLGQYPTIRLDPDAKSQVGDGLDLYISVRVAELSESKKYPAELTGHIKRRLKEKCAGTYLWISFVVKDLQEVEVSEVEEVLDQLPEGLYPLYERILEKIDLIHRTLALDILRWCVFAVEPLTPSQLASALKIKSTDLLDQESILREKLTYCDHFLSISTDASMSKDVINLVHQSAYDFLTKQNLSNGKIPWFSLANVEVEHSKLASACISYIQDVYREDEDVYKSNRFTKAAQLRYPFFNYAISKWHQHFNRANQYGVDIIKQYPEFFSNSFLWGDWAAERASGNRHELLTVASELGLTILVQRILKEKGHSIYWEYLFARKQKQEALHAASENGYLPIVKLLIESGVYVDCENKDKGTPLTRALRNNHRQVAEYLLTCGANINGAIQKSTPLMRASELENCETMKFLLEWKSQNYTRPRLKWSSQRIFAISDYTLNVNCQNGDGDTPLHIAIKRGSMEAIQMLLAHPGVDVRSVNEWNFNPMHLAIIFRQSDVVQYLMKKCNFLFSELDEHWKWSAVHFAAFNDSENEGSTSDRFRIAENHEILPLIIERLGVDPQFRTAKVQHPDDRWHIDHLGDDDSEFRTLTFTKYHFFNRASEVRSMISINQHDSCYETALSVAVKAGNETAITYLLDCCNIDPNASCRGCDEATPLHVAAQSLRFNTVGMLINRWKVNVNGRDHYQRTPLHLVVSAMMSSAANAWLGEKVVKELIVAGSQLSAKDINGNTPRDLFDARKNINEYTEESFQNMNLRELLTDK